jgi:hypothetical protein
MGSTRYSTLSITPGLVLINHKAIELAAESLANVKFVQEKKLIQKYFDEISQDTGKYCFGVEDTLKGLELGSIETLIVWENLDITRYILRNAANGRCPSMFFFGVVSENKMQRKLSSMRARSKRRTEKSSSTSPPDLRWNRLRSRSRC